MEKDKFFSQEEESLLKSRSKHFISSVPSIYSEMKSNKEKIKKTQEKLRDQLKKGTRQTDGSF